MENKITEDILMDDTVKIDNDIKNVSCSPCSKLMFDILKFFKDLFKYLCYNK